MLGRRPAFSLSGRSSPVPHRCAHVFRPLNKFVSILFYVSQHGLNFRRPIIPRFEHGINPLVGPPAAVPIDGVMESVNFALSRLQYVAVLELLDLFTNFTKQVPTPPPPQTQSQTQRDGGWGPFRTPEGRRGILDSRGGGGTDMVGAFPGPFGVRRNVPDPRFAVGQRSSDGSANQDATSKTQCSARLGASGSVRCEGWGLDAVFFQTI